MRGPLQTICVKAEDGVTAPVGPVFPVYAYNTYSTGDAGVILIDTGLNLKLPDSLRISIHKTFFHIIGHNENGENSVSELSEMSGRLVLYALGTPERMSEVAHMSIEARGDVRVRFMELSSGGGRVIRGDGQQLNAVRV
jgi:hypothetical protein